MVVVADSPPTTPRPDAALGLRSPPKREGVFLEGRWRVVAGVGAILVALIALALRSAFEVSEDDNVVCPAGLRRKAPPEMQNLRHISRRQVSLADPPSVLLREAQSRLAEVPPPISKPEASEQGHAAEAWKALKACVSWALPQSFEPRIGARLSQHSSMSPLVELRSQLECRGALLQYFEEPSRGERGEFESAESVVRKQSMQLVSQSRALLQRCVDLTTELQALRRAGAAENPQQMETPGRAVAALVALGDLEPRYRETLASLSWSQRLLSHFSLNQTLLEGVGNISSLEDNNSDGGDEGRVRSMRTDLRGSLLRAVREARAVASKLPESHFQVRRAMKCNPELLVATEELAVNEAEEEVDPAFVFALGMHQSELVLIASATKRGTMTVPFFGSLQGGKAATAKALDEFGLEVPAAVATAELLLLRAEQNSTGTEISLLPASESRASLRAKRLLRHAQGVLDPLQLHEAVAKRLRKAADIFVTQGQPKLAARAFSDLAQHKLRRGNHEEALAAASEALAQDRHDAVGLYLQATLKRGLGELKSHEDIKKAKKQLQEAAGRLPAKSLEAERAAVHSELWAWGVVAERGDFRTCFELHDAARVLICLICRLAMPP